MSLGVHAAILAALGRVAFAPPEAPVTGSGGRDGGEIEVEIALGAPAPGPEPEPPPVPVPVPVPVPEPETATETATETAAETAAGAAVASETETGTETASAATPPPAPPPPEAPPPGADAAGAPVPSPAPDAAPGPVAAVPDGAGIPEPRYPASCRRLGHEGTAIVRVEVDAGGEPGQVDLIRSAGCIELDRSALEALRRSRFRPARRAGIPVASVLEQRIRFQLR